MSQAGFEYHTIPGALNLNKKMPQEGFELST